MTGLLDKSKATRESIRVGFWIAKALILRLVNVNEVLSRLLDLLSLEELGSEVAHGFQLLLASDEVLSKKNGATIRLLARQKTFHAAIPNIAKAFRDTEAHGRPNYLIALSGILQCVDSSILITEVPTILPLLLQSLDLEQQEVKAASIGTLAILAQEDPDSIGEHVSSIVGRLLSAAANSKTSSQASLFYISSEFV